MDGSYTTLGALADQKEQLTFGSTGERLSSCSNASIGFMTEAVPTEAGFKRSAAHSQDGRAISLPKRRIPHGQPDSEETEHKRQRTVETWSGDTHLSPPGGSSLNFSHRQQTDPLSSSAEVNPALSCKPSQILRANLGPPRYSDMRDAILRHQELFLGQLYDLHHTVQLQRHLVSICDHREAMNTELMKLEAEQTAHRNSISDLTVEQDEDIDNPGARGWQHGNEPNLHGSNAATSSRQRPNYQAGSVSSKQHVLSELQQSRQAHAPGFGSPGQAGAGMAGMQAGQQGMDMSQQGVWPGMFPRGYPLQYGQPMGGFNGWGMPMMGGFANPYSMPFGMMAPTIDPMMAWYAMHYGQYAHAMQNQANAANAANAQQQAEAQQEGEAAAAADEQAKASPEEDAQARQNLRWWQDPEKVFGIAANPAVVGNAPPAHTRQKLPKQDEMQAEVTSKPPEQQRSKKTVSKVKQDDHKSLSNPTKTSSKAPGGASGASEPIGSHQKAGSGLSAFKKLPTRSPNVRRPPTRAESIGSEVSRSAAERSPADEGESSGVDHAAAQRQ